MDYFYQKGTSLTTLVLLHGTGGDRHSLKSIAAAIAPAANLVALEGAVLEAGARRFFKRHGMNQFDYESLTEASLALENILLTVSQTKDLPLEQFVLLGYSNGANLASYFLQQRVTPVCSAILFHPMALGGTNENFSLATKNLWLSYGAHDPFVTASNFKQLILQLTQRGAGVTCFRHDEGHRITVAELAAAEKFWQTLEKTQNRP
ncbi:alpha/beta hydrolase [Enterococcus nangangensis]|uniref:alpha/beta hydrolase n=1 Tax=Enterococcus nangangensis TaxID=2559926 RepID=UPI0010F6E571|nr:dienelactone hydrolase family protein [Enterococcus nangangensis]